MDRLMPLSNGQRSILRGYVEEYQKQLRGAPEVLEYLTEVRGLGERVIEEAALGYVADAATPEHRAATGRLCLPYLTTSGPVKLRFRALPPHDNGAKYLDLPGAQTRMYGVRSLAADRDGSVVHLAEGEIDCLTAHMLGLTAVGVAGVQGWRPHFAQLLDGYDVIKVLADNDDNGQGAEFAEAVRAQMPRHDVQTVLMPEGHDVNSAYLEGGKENLLQWIQGTY